MLKSQIILITAYSGVNISWITERHLVPNWIKNFTIWFVFSNLETWYSTCIGFISIRNSYLSMIKPPLYGWNTIVTAWNNKRSINQFLTNQWISDGCIRNFGSKRVHFHNVPHLYRWSWAHSSYYYESMQKLNIYYEPIFQTRKI